MLALGRSDGSWPYRRGGAGLTETTCYALLACRAMQVSPPNEASSLAWLEARCLPNGGYSPQPSVQMANWVSSLASITLGAAGRTEFQRRAVEWLLTLQGNESAWLGQSVRSALGVKTPYPQNHAGWPWMEGTASWVAPTALALLALRQARESGRFPALHSALDNRIRQGSAMLLERRCADGGWNHGAPAALEVSATSYPETTGLAIVALGADAGDARQDLARVARAMMAQTRSATALSWLQLGLLVLNAEATPVDEAAMVCRTSVDLALRVLALAALDGNNIFRA
jgi:hypothetical protein